LNFGWLREPDLNRRPSGYEPDELPGCSIPRHQIIEMLLAARKHFLYLASQGGGLLHPAPTDVRQKLTLKDMMKIKYCAMKRKHI
jgi:membrane-bound lytic murein transglycosylase A